MSRKYITYLSCFAMMLYAINITVISPLIMEIAETFGLDIGGVGVIFTFIFIGFTTFIILGGLKADKIGKKKTLNIAVVGLTASLFGFALAPKFLILCIIAIFIGGFGGVLESITSAFIHDINPKKPEFYVNMSQIFFGIGAVIGPITVGFAVSKGVTWRMCYMVLAILSLLFTIFFLKAKDTGNLDLKSHEGKKSFHQLRKLLKNKTLLLVSLCMFFYTGSEVGGWGWMSTYLDKSFEFTPTKAGFALALFWIAMTLGRIFCGMLTLRFKTVKVVMILAFSSAVFTVMSVFIRNEIGIFFIIAAMGFAYSSQFPLIISYGGNQVKESSGMVFSIMIATAGIGNMIVPYLMGLIGDAFEMRTAMILPSVLLFFTGIIFSSFKDKKQKTKAREF